MPGMTRISVSALVNAAAGLLIMAAAGNTAAELPGEGPRLREIGVTVTQAEIAGGHLDLDEIRRQGRLVFSTPFNKADGYGDGPDDHRDPISPGGRPTLQGNGTFLRVNGLDGQSCLECHSIVSNRSVPATFGIGGVGGSVTNAIFQPTFIDVADAEDGFDGRFINPPFLFGSGGIQLLANEMTADLQALATKAASHPGEKISLITKGVSFGTIRYRGGRLDTSRVEGVDPDLVVRPFGRKGEFSTVRSFDLGALQFHLGMQPVEVFGEADADEDGVASEISIGEVSALEIFNTTLERPRRDAATREVRRGEKVFLEVGCADCHKPMLKTRSRFLGYRYPEDPTDPEANIYYEVDLSRAPAGFKRVNEASLAVPLFADLKRHDMGRDLAESFGSPLDAQFTTARLWGVSDTAPYLHDGRATTLAEAILQHGGEGRDARDAFAELDAERQAQLLAFLHSLRTPEAPSADLDR